MGHRPGPKVMDDMGGLHSFMAYPRAMLTDSGGFQMVSLLDLAEITEVKRGRGGEERGAEGR